MSRTLALICMILTVVTFSERAAGAEIMTFETALAVTYETNPQLEAERAKLRATDEGVAKAVSAWRPTIGTTGSYGWQRYTEPGFSSLPQVTHPQSAEATLNQSIFDGRTEPGIRQAKALVDAGRAELTDAEQSILLAAAKAYCEALRDENIVDLYVKDIAQLRGLQKNTEQRLALGELTKTDAAQASARLIGAQLNLEAAEQQLTTSRADFEHIVGRPPEALQNPILPKVPAAEDNVLQIALRDNPTIAQSQAQARAADHNVSAAIGALLPSLSIQAQYGRSIDDIAPGIRENGVTVTGQISVPLYQGGAEEAAVREAKEQRSQASFAIFESERQVRESVRTAWDALLTAQRSFQLASLEAQSDQAAYEGAQAESQVGSRTTLDILNANQELLQSKIAAITATCANQEATFQVMSAMGALTARALKLPVRLYDPQRHYDDDADRWIGLGD